MKHRSWLAAVASVLVLASGLTSFYAHRPARAGPISETSAPGLLVAPGYAARLAASELSAPVGAAAAPDGILYVAESGRGTGTPPRVLRLAPGQPRATVASDFPAPLTGITWHEGKLLVSYAGGIDLLDPSTGVRHAVLKDLPAQGDYPNGAAAIGPDGKLYFGVGTATNAGVVGPDNIEQGWVQAAPGFHDIPCRPVTLRGVNHASPNPFTEDPHDRAATGAFSPFGQTTARFQVVAGSVPCTGAVLRANMDGSKLEMVAWGLRNPAALAFSPDGSLYVGMQGYEDRGSRPVVGDRDYLYRVEQDRWYGWPDFAGGRSLTEEEFQRPGVPLRPLLAEPPEQPPMPVATFDRHVDITGVLYPPDAFGLKGDALVALAAADPEAAPRILRLNPRTGRGTAFLENAPPTAADAAGASAAAGLERPVALAAAPGGSVYIVDSGKIEVRDGKPAVVPGTGRIWQIMRTGQGEG